VIGIDSTKGIGAANQLAAIFVLMWTSGCDQVFSLDRPPTDAAPPDTMLTCPSGYVAGTEGNYRVSTVAASWDEAVIDCSQDELRASSTGHTHLAVIGSVRELDAFPGPNGAIWIGLTDLEHEAQFAWITEEDPLLLFPADSGSPWATGEPNALVGDEDCVQLRPDGLNDAGCALRHRYVCECDAYGVRSLVAEGR
jgi:hypothetical protein